MARRSLLLRVLGWALVALVLAGVFGMYTDPEFMRVMADQVWACF
ncbi:hypothetical protein [Comamonas endophytica]|uniref:Uncharacterized protein n=1 Tax=Comamonas endophytica TaxID=2949090 RepID=A0ABY6GBB6_9BURK|nr:MULTISPECIES: hypothetical protein [unclassified Acidovorax]UYG52340.1 hypothetical protein M9799_03615 [Acidovorax sp. 5MLIR]